MSIISRDTFTSPEWYILQTSVFGTAKYISLQDKGIIDDWREKRKITKLLKENKNHNFYKFFRDLCNQNNYKSPIPKDCQNSADALEAPVLLALKQSVQLIKQKDPTKIDDFQNFVLNIAYCVSSSDTELTLNEDSAIKKIRAALYL